MQGNTQRRLPLAFLQLVDFEGNVPDGPENQSPCQFRGGGRQAGAARAHQNAALGACGHVNMRGARSRLADEFQAGRPLQHGTRKTSPLLRQEHRLEAP